MEQEFHFIWLNWPFRKNKTLSPSTFSFDWRQHIQLCSYMATWQSWNQYYTERITLIARECVEFILVLSGLVWNIVCHPVWINQGLIRSRAKITSHVWLARIVSAGYSRIRQKLTSTTHLKPLNAKDDDKGSNALEEEAFNWTETIYGSTWICHRSLCTRFFKSCPPHKLLLLWLFMICGPDPTNFKSWIY